MTRLIDASDAGILSSSVRVFMQKRLEPTLDVKKRYEMQFSAPIVGTRSNPNEPIIKSSGFTHNGVTQYIEDRVLATGEVNSHIDENATHVLQMYRIVNNQKVITNADIGYVNADTGLVVITSLQISAVPNTYINCFDNSLFKFLKFLYREKTENIYKKIKFLKKSCNFHLSEIYQITPKEIELFLSKK
jgi:hypothetical protein